MEPALPWDVLDDAIARGWTGVLAVHGDVHVVGTAAVASFVAFSLGASHGDRLVERTAVVYVDPLDASVRDVEHDWYDRVERAATGPWLPVSGGVVDRLRVAGPAGSVSWVRAAPAPAWLGDGTAVWHGTGGPLPGFASLPPAVRAFVETARPEFAFPPVLDRAAALAAAPRRGVARRWR